MSSIRYLILGASGLLGSCLFEAVAPGGVIGTAYRRVCKDLLYCDLGERESIEAVIRTARPQVIIHAAGMTRPDDCERSPELAWRVNVDAVRHICDMAPHESKTIMFSTDYVFDGERGGYVEGDPPRPINTYGRTKLAAEEMLLERMPSALVVRVAGLFGWSTRNREFLEAFARSEDMICSEEHRSSYTFLNDIGRLLPRLCGEAGVVHVVGPDVFTRYEFARLVCDRLGLQTRIRAVSGRIAYRIPRPRDSSLRALRCAGVMTPTVTALDMLARRLRKERGWAYGT